MAHTQCSARHRTANPHTPIPKAMRTRVMCAVIGLCVKQSLLATTLLHVRLEFWLVHFVRTYALSVIRTAILNWAMDHCSELLGWTPGRVRLSAEPAFCAFSNTLCGMSHRDQHKSTSSRAVKALITNAWL